MGFGPLRVINEDKVSPGGGFAPHGHANMEILSYVLSGGLAHKDNAGGGGVLRPGELQWMSAGHGIEHSEFNASRSEEHTSELQSLMRISYAVFCLKKQNKKMNRKTVISQ